MALVQLHGRANDPQTRQLLAAQLIGQGLSGFGQAMQGQKERDALGALLAGKAGPGLSQITQQGAPGLNPALAGPSRAMTSGQMAQPGMMHTGGQMTPQMAQAFMLQGGNPEQLASLMPKQMTPYETAQVDIERQKLAQGSGPASGLGKVAADLGIDISTPEGLAAAQQAMIGSSRAPVTNINMPQDQAKLSDLSAFRGQVQGESKDFTVVRDAYGKLRSALQNPSPAGDISIVYAYNQMLDPKSVVRTQDFEAAAKAGNFGDKVRSAVEQITSGQLLTDSQRADFANQAHGMFQSQLQGQQGREADFERMAGATIGNVPPGVIVPDMIGESANWGAVVPPAAPAAPPMAEQAGGLLKDLWGGVQREVQSFTGGGAPAQAPAPTTAKPPLSPEQLQSMSIDELARYYAQP